MLLVTHSPIAAAIANLGSSCSHLMGWSPPMAATVPPPGVQLIAGEFRAFPMRFVLPGSPSRLVSHSPLQFMSSIARPPMTAAGRAQRHRGADLQVRGADGATDLTKAFYPRLMAHSIEREFRYPNCVR